MPRSGLRVGGTARTARLRHQLVNGTGQHVRILGVNGGAVYKRAIKGPVTRLHAHGLYAILYQHWNAPSPARSAIKAHLAALAG